MTPAIELSVLRMSEVPAWFPSILPLLLLLSSLESQIIPLIPSLKSVVCAEPNPKSSSLSSLSEL